MYQTGYSHPDGCTDSTHQCHHNLTNPSVHQTLDELDFERGIWTAALSGDTSDVESKLRKSRGLVVNDVDKSGYTALHYACRNGHKDIVKLLLDYQANVNATTSAGQATPLHRASYMGHSEIVELLLENGASTAPKDSDGMTPLHKAAQNNHEKVIKVLLCANRDVVNLTDSKGRRPSDLTNEPQLKDLILKEQNIPP